MVMAAGMENSQGYWAEQQALKTQTKN